MSLRTFPPPPLHFYHASNRMLQLMVLVMLLMFLLTGSFLSPDEVTFAVLLRGHGASDPPAWQQMDGVLNKMQSYGMSPTAVSYNVLLEVCLRTNDMQRGMDVMDRMVADDVEPDEMTEEVVARKRVLRSYFRKVFM